MALVFFVDVVDAVVVRVALVDVFDMVVEVLVVPVDVVVVNLRDPVERVLSEYYFCVSRKNCVQQLQWDYAHRGTRDATAAFVTLLRARMLAHLNGTRSLGLKEFVNWPGNPAHERMSQYVSGLRYGQFWRGAALEDARRNLCDDRTVVLLSADRPNASLALARRACERAILTSVSGAYACDRICDRIFE